MDRAADEVVAAERERDVADAAADAAEREAPVQLGDGPDEVGGVVVVPGNAGRHGEHVRVQHDVLLGEPRLFGQELHGARQRFDAAFVAVRLALLVERHHEDGRAEAAYLACLRQERLFAFLEGDRVHDGASLHAAERGADDVPVRGVDHERHGGDVGLARGVQQEPLHGGGRVEQGVVHVNVDDGGAVFDLVARDRHGAGHVVRLHDVQELAGPRHVGAFADVDEILVAGGGEGVEAGEAQETRLRLGDAGLHAVERLRDRRDVGGRRTAASARDIELSGVGERTDHRRHLFGRLRVFTLDVGQSGVGVRTDEERRLRRHFRDMRTELLRAERAVEPDGEEVPGVGNGDQKGFGALPGEQASAGVAERGGDHDRDVASAGRHRLLGGEERRLAVQRVEYGFDQDDVRAGVEHRLHARPVGRGELVERDVAGGGVLHVG